MNQNNNNILNDFFSKTFEKGINEKMMYYSYCFDYDLVNNYVANITSVQLNEFIQYIVINYDVSYLEAKDVLQFSDFKDCTIRICDVIKKAGDHGFNFLEIGKYLESDDSHKKDSAYIKYGENHSKTATDLGLLYNLSNKYFLSCLGFIVCDLSEEMQEKLICRLILRNKLIKRFIYHAIKDGEDSYSNEVDFLSESTMIRRKSNVKKILGILANNKEYNLTGLIERIKF